MCCRSENDIFESFMRTLGCLKERKLCLFFTHQTTDYTCGAFVSFPAAKKMGMSAPYLIGNQNFQTPSTFFIDKLFFHFVSTLQCVRGLATQTSRRNEVSLAGFHLFCAGLVGQSGLSFFCLSCHLSQMQVRQFHSFKMS